MLMKKPSCIGELKELADKLSDRDVSLKSCFTKVKTIINCSETTETEKVKKIKEICNGI